MGAVLLRFHCRCEQIIKVSITTFSLNSSDKIENTVRNILCQDHEDVEYAVVNGGSADGTRDIVEKYQGRVPAYVPEPDSGTRNAMNKGIKLSTGEFIASLNSNDVREGRIHMS